MQRAFLVHGLPQAFEDVGHFALLTLVPLEIFRLWCLRSGPDALPTDANFAYFMRSTHTYFLDNQRSVK